MWTKLWIRVLILFAAYCISHTLGLVAFDFGLSALISIAVSLYTFSSIMYGFLYRFHDAALKEQSKRLTDHYIEIIRMREVGQGDGR